PCVAKGLRSSPGTLCCEAEIPGPLRAPFATQGRSHKKADRNWVEISAKKTATVVSGGFEYRNALRTAS
ncbi:hypothetical protein, partial [Pseudomonas sp. LP23]|uniref:hypothetical protein n=1 Tax=Pseudomonas sp. LP23 TaxID=3029195 RepID=UPI0030C51965